MLKFAPGLDLGVVALIVTAVGVVTPLILHALVKNTALRFLFVRPAWAKLPPRRAARRRGRSRLGKPDVIRFYWQSYVHRGYATASQRSDNRA